MTRTRTHRAPDVAAQIAAHLSGQEWSPDTLNEIADMLRAAGYSVLDIADQDESDDGPPAVEHCEREGCGCDLHEGRCPEGHEDPSGQACPQCGAVQDCTPDCTNAARFRELVDAAAEAVEQFGEDELEQHAADFAQCPMCGGHGNALGMLGRRLHLRCRQCGMDFSREVPR